MFNILNAILVISQGPAHNFSGCRKKTGRSQAMSGSGSASQGANVLIAGTGRQISGGREVKKSQDHC
jgi:hypothetical protein